MPIEGFGGERAFEIFLPKSNIAKTAPRFASWFV